MWRQPQGWTTAALLTLMVGVPAAPEGLPVAVKVATSVCIPTVAAGLAVGATSLGAADLALIPAGTYEPLLRGRDEPERVAVAAFRLEVRPVTNGEFLEFVRAHPRWRRSQVTPLFAEAGYLADWAGDLELGPRASSFVACTVPSRCSGGPYTV